VDKDTEIKLLKEMIGSVKTIVKAKNTDITRYRIRVTAL